MTRRKIVIVGAGAIGLASAVELAKRGHDVTLIDGDSADWDNRGCAASLAAAGMLAPLVEAAALPQGAHSRAAELLFAAFDVWRGAASEHVRFEGGLVLGDEMCARIDAVAQAQDRSMSALTRGEIDRRFGLRTACETGSFVAEEGAVAPVAQMRAWLEELRALGGKAHFDIEAETIERKSWGRVVRCMGGEMFSADEIVLAPGVWARESLIALAPALRHVRPAKGQMTSVRLESALRPNVHAGNFYLAARGGEDAALGSTMEFDRFDRRPDPEKIAALKQAVGTLLPGALHDGESRSWAGVRPMSPDWAPLIGRSGPDGAIVACGHSRNGWLLAPITARIVAAYVEEKTVDPLWAAFAPDRFDGGSEG